jgi:MFS transporter, PAT family, beta-lactamase induction signal transducer AmpG
MSDEPIGSQPPEPRSVSPWLWVPTLYFAESIPNAVVSDTAKFLYNDLGVTPKDLGVITGSMYLPWVLKPLWSPLVELVKTKRWWIPTTQFVLALCFFALASVLHSPHWLVLSAAVLWVVAFTSATHDIAADGFYMLGLNERDQAAFTGVRATAYRLAMLCAKGFMVAMAGRLTLSVGKLHGWSSVFCIPAAFYIAFALYHMFVLPRPDTDKPASSENFVAGYVETFASFFRKPGLGTAIAFMLLFRFAEAQLLAMVAPFLTGPRENGALGLTTADVGVAYGTYGVIGIICGGILGGMLVARFGLRRMFWLLIVTMHVPNFFFLYLSWVQPTSLALISGCLFVEQFGYGFGFTTYMLYLMYFARGERQTAHYAISTGFMALSLMLPQMLSGYAQTELGFRNFFVYILICTLPSFWVAWLAWRNKNFIDTFPPADAPKA